MVDKNIYIVQGEICTVVGAIKRNSRWNTHTLLDEEQDPLLNNFSHLKEILNNMKGSDVPRPNDLAHGPPGQEDVLVPAFFIICSRAWGEATATDQS
uniref:Golgi brefeldin A resistant guanine nucleotide exchange factor 1 n=1 Tax=Salmo trutta TaxID=8032 RepID=A0A674BYY4_SALTR